MTPEKPKRLSRGEEKENANLLQNSPGAVQPEKGQKSPKPSVAVRRAREEPQRSPKMLGDEGRRKRGRSPAPEAVLETPAAKRPQRRIEDPLCTPGKECHVEHGGRVEPVGMVILLSEPCDIQPGHESSALRSAIAEARNRISDYELRAELDFQKASRAEKTVCAVKGTILFRDTGGDLNTLRMEAGELVWRIQEDEVRGPLSWNQHSCRLSGGDWFCKPDSKSREELNKVWELSDVPLSAFKLTQEAKKLKEAVEAVGQLVGKRVNGRARQELFKLLRKTDREAWNNLMNGKRGVPGLLEAYYAGKVKIANGPGFELIEDKELCQYVEQLIRFYLKEEPILKTVPTRSFALPSGGGDMDLLRMVFDNPSSQKNCVLKRVDGRGGDGVWVGAKISREQFRAARLLVAAEPEAFIVQKYTCLSQVNGNLVDIRGPAFICNSDTQDLSGGQGVGRSPVLWGRGVPAEGSTGKVNISEAGFELAIGVSDS